MSLVDPHLHWGKMCTEAVVQGTFRDESELVTFLFYLPKQMFSALFCVPRWGILSHSLISPYGF